MDVREKLIEWIKEIEETCRQIDCDDCEYKVEYVDCQAYLIADYLISKGVTVQEWISVKDRLPNDGNKVIVYNYENGDFHKAKLNGELWHLDCGWLLDVDDFTHWMPTPQPPKGE